MAITCLLEISFRLLPGKQLEFTQSLPIVVEPGGRKGVGRTLLYAERDDPDHYLWVEEWTDCADLERHLKTDWFRTLMGGLRTLATVEDCRIVDLKSSPQSEATPGYGIHEVEGREVLNGD